MKDRHGNDLVAGDEVLIRGVVRGFKTLTVAGVAEPTRFVDVRTQVGVDAFLSPEDLERVGHRTDVPAAEIAPAPPNAENLDDLLGSANTPAPAGPSAPSVTFSGSGTVINPPERPDVDVVELAAIARAEAAAEEPTWTTATPVEHLETTRARVD